MDEPKEMSRADASEGDVDYRGKRLAIMQPYFFPYIGYFGLIAAVDRWIVFDPVKYVRKGWMNRNRVLKAGGGVKYIGVTVAKHGTDTPISDIRLVEDTDRFDRLVRHLDAYAQLNAPHYGVVLELLRDCVDTTESGFVTFLTRCLQRTCAYLGIPFQYEIYSEMKLSHPEPRHPMDWSLHICHSLGAGEYVNLPGGRNFFDPKRFREAGIGFHFYEQTMERYSQRGEDFIPGLSILDVLMFNSAERVQEMLCEHRMREE